MPDSNDPRLVDGAAFVLDAPTHVPAVWGDGTAVAWATGEPLMLVGPPGIGKSTVAQQLALARADVAGHLDVLGMMVTPDERPVLYIAADRPGQIARSMRRMVKPLDRQFLETNLIVWRGPLAVDLVTQPTGLLELAESVGAGTVIIDSLKDVALRLSDDETGGAVNRALQLLCAAGVEVLVLHHQRKAQATNQKPKSLADVYGSAWLTAGAGSVLLLWGDPGDAIVELTHLKQPTADIGPLSVLHEHDHGRSTVADETNLTELLDTAGVEGLTARQVAERRTGTTEPGRNQVEKARRQLEGLVKREIATKDEPSGPSSPVVYRVTVRPVTGSVRGARNPSRSSMTADEQGSRTPSRTLTPPVATPLRGRMGVNVNQSASTARTDTLADLIEDDPDRLLAAFPGSEWERT